MNSIEKNEKIIIIGGGVGPAAGVELHKKIIENTVTNGTDQAHFEVYHFSRSHDISDRSKFLLNVEIENPSLGMFRTVKAIKKVLVSSNKDCVLGIPCDKFHSPNIFNNFLFLLKQHKINIHVLNMIDEVFKFIQVFLPNLKTIGLLSTTGTRQSCIYSSLFKCHNIDLKEIPLNLQEELHDTIYNKDWGLKAMSKASTMARNNFEKYVNILCAQDVEAIILGCSEIPLALPEQKFKGVLLIDPTLILARALISCANSAKLKPLPF